MFQIQESSSGKWLNNEVDIQNERVKFFSSLLSAPIHKSNQIGVDREDMLQAISTLVTDQDNVQLNKLFTLDEMKAVVFSLKANKVPGPNGFTTLFFQKCWDFIGNDLLKALEESRTSSSMLK